MATDFRTKKFLVIDDFPEMRSSLKRMLESFGVVDADDVDTGERALERMSIKPYDIILCDYNLGPNRKDGQQVLEEAKHRGLIGYATVFMMITAEKTMEMVMGAVEYKPDDYLTKPFTKDVLKTRLERLLVRKGDLADIQRAVKGREYRKAIELCDAKLDSNPPNLLDLLSIKGDICIEAGEYDSARAAYERVLSMRDIPWARFGQGKVCFLKKEYEPARQLFQQLIDDNRLYVEAYDWLAKALIELGDAKQAQAVLKQAVELSPKAILRQQRLGQVALENKDLEVAEKSYQAAVNLGTHSFLKDPGQYTGLAKVLVEKDTPDAALRVIESSKKEFRDREDADLQSSVMEGVIYKKLNRADDAQQAMERASTLYEKLDGKVATDVAMDMAKACFVMGDADKGKSLVENIVRNHHEDEHVLRQVEGVVTDAGLQEEGMAVIERTRKEMVDVNNKGVYLVKEGKLEEAIEFLERAADGLPSNKTINLNAAQAMLVYMQRNGREDRFIYKSRQYLDRVARIDPSGEKYQRLQGMFEGISGSA